MQQAAASSRSSGVSRRLTWTLRDSLAVPREESELFPGFKQAQIVANLCVLGAPSAREEEWILQSNKNTGGSINPAPLVRPDSPPTTTAPPTPRCFKMFGPGDVNYLPMHLLPPLFVSLYQHLVFGVAGGEKKWDPFKAKSSQFPLCSCY